MSKFDRTAVDKAFAATEKFMTTGVDEERVRKLRRAPFVNLGQFLLAIDLRRGDEFQTGPGRPDRAAISDRSNLNKVAVGNNLSFPYDIPTSLEDNVAFMMPLVPTSTSLAIHTLREQKGAGIFLRLTREDVNERLRVISPQDLEEIHLDGRLYDPRRLAPGRDI